MINTFTADGMQIVDGTDYQAGVCNIGPAEIRRRRRTGHVGLAAAIALLAVLVAIDAPPIARLLVVVPATLSASGYLQAALKFCAAYGALGVFNFGAAGTQTSVADEAARSADRRRAFQIALSSLGIGIVVGAVAFLLPV